MHLLNKLCQCWPWVCTSLRRRKLSARRSALRARSRRIGALVCLGVILGGPVASIDPQALEMESAPPPASLLLEWFSELRDHSNALHERLPEEQRVAHVREIASLLEERGLS